MSQYDLHPDIVEKAVATGLVDYSDAARLADYICVYPGNDPVVTAGECGVAIEAVRGVYAWLGMVGASRLSPLALARATSDGQWAELSREEKRASLHEARHYLAYPWDISSREAERALHIAAVYGPAEVIA
ncbi:hypothetical protein [Actinobaculum sp. 352]|uniref:hypothetical protein n=1 Tax=Actinobaculum sp. 352 TaxID=2490946 RepID=UPI000F7E1DA3|nr:hypothetical protein [Actinobaculum sp. 352]RTE49341.1 hypothetical protein EKN07_07175 [Actinobaculum sp. 352]